MEDEKTSRENLPMLKEFCRYPGFEKLVALGPSKFFQKLCDNYAILCGCEHIGNVFAIIFKIKIKLCGERKIYIIDLYKQLRTIL